MVKKIAQCILLVVIIAFAYVIFQQVSNPIKFEQDLKAKKTQVIDRIKDIRIAQRAFKSKYQRFTSTFDSLADFILHDSLVLERKLVDEDDSVGMARLKKLKKRNIEEFKVAVIDTIFNEKGKVRRLTAEDVYNFRFVPGTNNKVQYTMNAGIVTTESKIVIPVIEVKVAYQQFLDTVNYRQEVINLIKDEALIAYNKYPGIKFGSMETGNNEAGNWED